MKVLDDGTIDCEGDKADICFAKYHKWAAKNARGLPTIEQTRIESLIETTTDMILGFIVSWAVFIWVVPILWPDYDPGVGVAFGITACMTVTSFIRRYITRRFFARGFHMLVHKLVRRFI